MAVGDYRKGCVQLSRLERLESLDDFEKWVHQPQRWLGVFDLPFGLPRELVVQLGWPDTWPELMRYYAGLDRQDIRNTFAAFCNARAVGKKFAHRAVDKLAGSSPSMKWVNPPVAFMLHAGVPRLMNAGVHLPGLHNGDTTRVAVEGYPGLLAREILGQRSYKNDNKSKQTPDRLIARKDLITALELGQTRLNIQLKLTHAQRDTLIDDAKGDSLDAVLCMLQAAWAKIQQEQGALQYGLPACIDPLEGWIITA